MNTQFFGFLLGLGALLASAGCASLQSVSVTNIPSERSRPIQATANNPAFLGIHFDNDFADGVPEELRRQCPNGKVTGVYAKYETTWYVLVENRSVTAKAYCVPGEARPPTAGFPTPPGVLPPPPPPSSAAALTPEPSPELAKRGEARGAKSKGGSS